MVSTHVDDFDLARKAEFVELVTEKISAELDVSQIENNHFCFTRRDVKKVVNGI